MRAKKVIHTVGPIWQNNPIYADEKLHNCYINSLRLAEKYKLGTIAFPNISTGIYGFPKERAAKIAITAVEGYNSTIIKKVVFVCFDDNNHQLYIENFNKKPS